MPAGLCPRPEPFERETGQHVFPMGPSSDPGPGRTKGIGTPNRRRGTADRLQGRRNRCGTLFAYHYSSQIQHGQPPPLARGIRGLSTRELLGPAEPQPNLASTTDRHRCTRIWRRRKADRLRRTSALAGAGSTRTYPYYYPSFSCFLSKKFRRVLPQVV